MCGIAGFWGEGGPRDVDRITQALGLVPTYAIVLILFGESNVITSRITKLDFGLVQHNFTQPELGDYADQLISHVANGMVDEIAGPAAQAPE